MESAWPRTIAASRLVIFRAGSGSRALPGASPGRSAAKLTSSSGALAIAFRQEATERLNGSVGASLVLRNLELEVVLISPLPVVPAKAGTHNHRRSLRQEKLSAALHSRRHAVWVPAFAGTTYRVKSAERHVHRRFRQLRVEAALVELGDEGTFELVALVEEGDPERKTDVAKDVGVFRPGDHRARAHPRRPVAIGESVAGEIGEANHLVDDVAALRGAIVLGLGQHDLHFLVMAEVVQRGDDRPAV